MFLFWNWIPRITCYNRNTFFAGGFVTYILLSSYRESSSGFGSGYTLLTFCWCSMAISVSLDLLLRFLSNHLLTVNPELLHLNNWYFLINLGCSILIIAYFIVNIIGKIFYYTVKFIGNIFYYIINFLIDIYKFTSKLIKDLNDPSNPFNIENTFMLRFCITLLFTVALKFISLVFMRLLDLPYFVFIIYFGLFSIIILTVVCNLTEKNSPEVKRLIYAFFLAIIFYILMSYFFSKFIDFIYLLPIEGLIDINNMFTLNMNGNGILNMSGNNNIFGNNNNINANNGINNNNPNDPNNNGDIIIYQDNNDDDNALLSPTDSTRSISPINDLHDSYNYLETPSSPAVNSIEFLASNFGVLSSPAAADAALASEPSYYKIIRDFLFNVYNYDTQISRYSFVFFERIELRNFFMYKYFLPLNKTNSINIIDSIKTMTYKSILSSLNTTCPDEVKYRNYFFLFNIENKEDRLGTHLYRLLVEKAEWDTKILENRDIHKNIRYNKLGNQEIKSNILSTIYSAIYNGIEVRRIYESKLRYAETMLSSLSSTELLEEIKIFNNNNKINILKANLLGEKYPINKKSNIINITDYHSSWDKKLEIVNKNLFNIYIRSSYKIACREFIHTCLFNRDVMLNNITNKLEQEAIQNGKTFNWKSLYKYNREDEFSIKDKTQYVNQLRVSRSENELD